MLLRLILTTAAAYALYALGVVTPYLLAGFALAIGFGVPALIVRIQEWDRLP